jgi:hypothetical protein
MQDLIVGSIPLLVAFLISLLCYKQLEPKWLRLFSWFLLTTFIIQTGGYYYSYFFKKSNHFIFNTLIFIEYEFYIYIFYKALLKPVFKRLAFIINVIFILSYLYVVVLSNHFFTYSSLAGNIGEFLTLCCCFLYLIELLMIDDFVNYFTIPMFFITTGVMISAVGNFLYLCFFNYIITNNLDPEGQIYGIIMTSLSIIEYGFFTIGFLCKKLWGKTR